MQVVLEIGKKTRVRVKYKSKKPVNGAMMPVNVSTVETFEGDNAVIDALAYVRQKQQGIADYNGGNAFNMLVAARVYKTVIDAEKYKDMIVGLNSDENPITYRLVKKKGGRSRIK